MAWLRLKSCLLLVLACAGGACAKREQTVAARLIDSDGSAVASLDPQTDLAFQAFWRPAIDAPADLAAWSFLVPSAAAKLASPEGGIDLAPLRESRYLTWTGRLDSGSVDALRFRFGAPLQGQAELYWNGPGEEFAAARYALQTPAANDPRQVTFDFGSARSWRGTVARIGLRLLVPPASGQALLRAEGLRYVAPDGMGGGETKTTTLDGLSMLAWLARPGLGIHRRVNVPRGGHLRFAAAAWLPGSGSVRIRVVAQGSHASRVVVDRELSEQGQPPRRRWTGIEADLEDFAGERVDLLFETGPALRGSLVAWGNPHLVGAARDRRPNVLLISLDTVRADHLSLYGYGRPTSPHLAAWARQWATVFDTAVASAPWTLPSHVSMLSGIDALHHGINRHGPIPPSFPLLPQRFHDAGYATYATTAGVLLTPELGFARGFDEFHVRGAMQSLVSWDTELADGIADTLRWLTVHRGERFFLFFHTFEAHAPYQPREPYFSSFGGTREALNAGEPVWMEAGGVEAMVRPFYVLFRPPTYAAGVTYPKRELWPQDRALATALYDSGLAYADLQLGRLLETLESTGLLENTVVVVTSDHGESLYEHGLVGHSSLYDHDLLVPLVIAAPLASARGRRVAAQVRSVDIAPTLVELAGLKPLGDIDGRSLVPLLRGKATPPRDAWSYALSTVRGVSLRTAQPPRKLIAQDTIFEPFRGDFEEYDLGRDRSESQNVPNAGVETGRRRLAAAVTPGASAVEIRVANAGPGELSGLLSDDAIDAMITSPDLHFSCCASTPLGVRFQAPAGARYTLVLPDRTAGSLRLQIRIAGKAWEGSMPLAGGSRHLRVVWTGESWQPVSGEASAGEWTGVDIRHQSSVATAPGREEELRDKLRTLGYLK